MVIPFLELLIRKNCKKQVKKKIRIEKVVKRKGDKLSVKWIGYNNSFSSWINKKRPCIKMSQYFPKPFRIFGGNINVKVGLSNYATKTDLKDGTHIDISSFTLKTNLTSLKTEVDELDIDKLAPILVDLKNVVKEAVYYELAAKVNNIDTSEFVLKIKYKTDKAKLEKKIVDATDFVKKNVLN